MVTVQSVDGSASTEQVALPAVFSAPLRSDVVVQVKNLPLTPPSTPTMPRQCKNLNIQILLNIPIFM